MKKINSLILVIILISMIWIPTSLKADNSTIEIKREEVKDMAITYSPMIKGMELDRINLSQNYNDLKKQMEGLEMLYVQLDEYKRVYNLYDSMSENYQLYLLVASDPTRMAEVPLLLDADDENFPDTNNLSNAEETVLVLEVANPSNMQIPDYMAYTMMVPQFEMMGIMDPNLSKEEEYNRFISPTKIAPAGMQNGMMILGVGIEQASSGIGGGAEALYDAIQMLKGYEQLQEMNKDMATKSLKDIEKRYELGQISELAYKQAINDEKIAILNYETMKRDVDNMIMNLNVMLGKEVTTKLALVDGVKKPVLFGSLDIYIERGLKERGEILSNSYNKSNKENEIKYVEAYLRRSSIEYKRLNNNIIDLDLEKAYLDDLIIVDIKKAYANVISKGEEYRINKLKMEDSLRQQSDMKLNVELGLVTENRAAGVDILVLQTTNDYNKAYREYFTAVSDLELISGIGKASR